MIYERGLIRGVQEFFMGGLRDLQHGSGKIPWRAARRDLQGIWGLRAFLAFLSIFQRLRNSD